MPDGPQGALDLRALELAAGNSAVVAQHLIECRDRYLAIAASIRDLYSFLWKVAGALVFLLLTIIGYLVSKGGLPGHG